MYPSASKRCAQSTPQNCTVRNVPNSIQILPTLHPLILHCAQCSHQYPNIVLTAPINTPLCIVYLSVFKYCAHCNPQYCIVCTVPTSMQIVSPLHASELYCAKCTHKNPNIAKTAPLNTALSAVYLLASKYCAHFTPQYCNVHTVPTNMRISCTLHHSVLQCAQCSHQDANSAPTAPLNIPPRAMFPSATPCCAHCTDQDTCPVTHSSSSCPCMDSQGIKHRI